MNEMTIYIEEAAQNRKSIQTLETSLMDIEGIERALIDVADGEVKLTYNSNKIKQETIVSFIQEKGLSFRSAQ
ncbi:hypothetical protein [Bacillus suaedae]|uniref:HMA domain-containing protein n=1 Tax=Halalkalibacter suaedae TaxID=2822140 RepID=A0A940WYH8_9BACI|nr:hypothetical protein [Bacillus suaedae]MBP3953058.1 hypothetical protein [Bacillus suaedae]